MGRAMGRWHGALLRTLSVTVVTVTPCHLSLGLPRQSDDSLTVETTVYAPYRTYVPIRQRYSSVVGNREIEVSL